MASTKSVSTIGSVEKRKTVDGWVIRLYSSGVIRADHQKNVDGKGVEIVAIINNEDIILTSNWIANEKPYGVAYLPLSILDEMRAMSTDN